MNIPSRVNPLGYDNSMPPGYIRVDFLENTGSQYLRLPVKYGQTSGLAVTYKVKPYSDYSYLSIIRYRDKNLNVGRIAADRNTGIAASSSPPITAFVVNNGKIFAAYNEYESGKIKGYYDLHTAEIEGAYKNALEHIEIFGCANKA